MAKDREDQMLRECGLKGVRVERGSVGSFDEIEEAKEEIRRNEVLRAKDEGEKKITFPPVVAGPFSGRGLPAGGRL